MGQLGADPASVTDEYVPTKTATNVLSPTTIVGGPNYSCTVQSGGSAFCWGDDPARAPDLQNWKGAAVTGVSGVDTLAAGDSEPGFACASSSGRVSCWGDNEYGQLGVSPNTVSRSMTPQPVIPGLTGVSVLVAGGHSICALTAAHKIYCWGDNDVGEIGLDPLGPPGPNNTPPNQSYVPVEVSGW